ncbi:MAG TPA: dienelactone hydrolase family protein [bacterium]|nr:dienelactone hydrolase family protein [bacterium]
MSEIRVPAAGVLLDGDLTVPAEALGVVLFAHGSGSSRFSPRNRRVAAALQDLGIGTLLIDLLTRDEEAEDERTAELRFDIGLLARRLSGIVEWLAARPEAPPGSIGVFGASTGAAAAAIAAAAHPAIVGAVVSRGGRIDLSGPAVLERLRAPTLLIVGARDEPVLRLNEAALGRLAGVRALAIVPGASHLFEEPGTLDEVVRLAGMWFGRYLGAGD